MIAYGRRGGERVVLKLVTVEGDEWHAGAVAAAFGGRGMVRVLEFTPGAMLLERLEPGNSLRELVNAGHDDEATIILADVIATMSPAFGGDAYGTVRDWGRGFAQYAKSGDDRLPPEIVTRADRLYHLLEDSQSLPRLLHGDLQHSNVILDAQRGWVAIDPKGVVGELEFELGAALRKPQDRPDIFATPATIERRVRRFAARLGIDPDRAVAWAFAQAVLSAIWEIEDRPDNKAPLPSFLLAQAIGPMLDRSLRKLV